MNTEQLQALQDENPSYCPICDSGDSQVLGALGLLVHFRCNGCGIEFSHALPARPKLILSSFYLEGDKHHARGFTDGSHWNGWATPKFIRDEIESYLTDNEYPHTWEGKTLIVNWKNSDAESFTPAYFNTARLGRVLLYELDGLTWVDSSDK